MRRFIQLFSREIGLTPKVFCRVRRFQHVRETIYRERLLEWSQIALKCGYYDRPQFITISNRSQEWVRAVMSRQRRSI